ncbi:TPA: tyrosine-type recombinase/integrase [Klebsiella pneumoniae]|mgnify:FL=1|uniref:Type 1 fimbriae regulatory protein FimB n=1 Tax=Klebsiella pneumoniae TaxID=573 RepID=A0AB74QLQ8_KLEPN|nr:MULTISPECIES: tyrosine-type recombinase/integrase [Klebsiella]HDQ5286532.1 tyrosine-type recombinase/integrase [Raoultella ornithinolytica]KAB2320716.1 tyrosine-type recombinase/integrase [Klebsiella quasipneumoniae]MBW3345325.1 tyrosine-type recombinase/integrase [Klebsiella pneumoniae]MCS6400533.1 tyrosine-type recombinase/integrase [Klebsiella quasipneumoniae subsp. similipneumoniae]MCS6433648.1 tyrosine-type recombinase/integrase [Klebsiella pneumoniae]
MAISRGARRTDGLESAEQVQMVVEEIAKKSQTVADLFLLGVETQLRGVDMREWKWSDLDIGSQVLRITQDKTKEAVEVELTETARDVLQARYNERGENVYVFQNDSNRSKGKPISRSKIHAEIQYAVDKLKARKLLPQDAVISMHSSRKTVATIAHSKGEDLEVISKMLGHRSTEHTRAYLGITQAKVDALRTKYSTGIKRGSRS